MFEEDEAHWFPYSVRFLQITFGMSLLIYHRSITMPARDCESPESVDGTLASLIYPHEFVLDNTPQNDSFSCGSICQNDFGRT